MTKQYGMAVTHLNAGFLRIQRHLTIFLFFSSSFPHQASIGSQLHQFCNQKRLLNRLTIFSQISPLVYFCNVYCFRRLRLCGLFRQQALAVRPFGFFFQSPEAAEHYRATVYVFALRQRFRTPPAAQAATFSPCAKTL